MARGRTAPVWWATCIVLLALDGARGLALDGARGLALNGGYPLVGAASLPFDTQSPQAITYLVDSNGWDPDQVYCDGVCATSKGHCTLRAAIDEANCDGVPSIIKFGTRFQDLAGIYDGDLILSEDGTTIDASDMWDSVKHIPGVDVVGGTFARLKIIGSDIRIYGLYLGAGAIGIYVTGGGYNTIGGMGAGQRNVFLGDDLSLWSGSGHNNVVNNQFGTLDRETAVGGGTIVVETDHNTITDNLILGLNAGIGIEIRGSYNTLSDNVVGVTENEAQARPLQQGLLVKHGDGNVIGPYNVIAGNLGTGVEISDGRDNVVQGNHIGSSLGVGNGGVGLFVDGADNTLVQDNLIAHNGGHGLSVDGSDVTILGNTIEDNGGDGVYLDSASGTIGGPTWQERNTIGNNGGNGVHLTGAGPLTITGNCIGLSSCAYDNGNKGHGILLDNASANNTIGGDGPGEGNWIAWNDHDAIRLTGEGTTLNFIQGNVVGAPVSWAFPAPNGWHGLSLYDGADYNIVGGLGDYMANTILASTWTGLAVVNGDGNVLVGNRIGTDGAGHDWGNAYFGIYVMGVDNTVSLNEVAYNLGEAGVEVDGAASSGNALLANSIHDHAGQGIELANGGNGSLAAPVLNQAKCQGPVSGTACPGCSVEVFSDADDEGRFVEGSTAADAVTGAFSFSGSVAGPYVTATATDAHDNTSEFSSPFHVGTCNRAPHAAFTIHPASGPVHTVFTFDASTSSDHEDPTSALKVRWDWQNDGVYDTAWTKDKTATHAFDQAAAYTIRLQVKDSGGLTDATSRELSVEGGLLPNRVYLPLVRR